MRDVFEPRSEPAKTIYLALQKEMLNRKNCDGMDWLVNERKAVFIAARDYAQAHGLEVPTMAQVESWERYATGSVDYGAKWAYGVARVMTKTGGCDVTLFYLQDSRSFTGNNVMWWAKGCRGYTSNLLLAETYTKEQAQAMHFARTSDIPWPVEYIKDKTRPVVDMQYISLVEALEGSSLAIVKLVKSKPETIRCEGCNSFMSAVSKWAGACKRCGKDNRP